MARFFGEIGYAEGTIEMPPKSGKWVDQIIERKLMGELVRPNRRLEENENLNKEISVSTTISVVADAYANEHMFAIRYVKWAGAYWEVPEVTPDPDRPRLLLRLGGVYNGRRAPKSEDATP
jgi:hypothetical protein